MLKREGLAMDLMKKVYWHEEERVSAEIGDTFCVSRVVEF